MNNNQYKDDADDAALLAKAISVVKSVEDIGQAFICKEYLYLAEKVLKGDTATEQIKKLHLILDKLISTTDRKYDHG